MSFSLKMFCRRYILRYGLQESGIRNRIGRTVVTQNQRMMRHISATSTGRMGLPMLKGHTTSRATNDRASRLSSYWSDSFFNSSQRFFSEEKNDDIDIDYKQMTSLIKGGKSVVIDVREAEELEESGDVPGAVNIPMGQLEEALEMPPHKFRALYHTELPDPKDSDVIFICSHGIRSYVAVNTAKGLGFERSWHYGKGYDNWRECREREGS